MITIWTLFSPYFILFLFYDTMEITSVAPAVRFKRKSANASFDKQYLLNLPKEQLVQRIISMKQELIRSEGKLKSTTNSPKEKKKEFDFTKVKTRPIALKILYQGWNYRGFQIQSVEKNTVAQHILNALQKTCLIKDKDSSSFSCCGRTDAGVSAFNQVITLKVRSKLKAGENDDVELPYVKMLNANLPRDIRAIAWSSIPDTYSARFDCLYRNYKYWFPHSGLDIQAMNDAAQFLVGSHDFRNLCKMNVANGVVNFVRLVTHASVTKEIENSPSDNDDRYTMCVFHIRSQGFLWHQIRCIMSVLFMVGEGKEKPDIVKTILDINSCPRKPIYPMVIGEPLNLYDAEFNSNIQWKYDPQEIRNLLKDLHVDWSLHGTKSSMLKSMIKDIARESGCKSDAQIDISHFMDGVYPNSHIPLLARPTCESLENRINHFVKKQKLELIVSDEKM